MWVAGMGPARHPVAALRILLVRLRLIGDVVFTTPIVAALKQAYPTAEITYLVEPSARPVVALSPHIAEVITVPHTRGWRRVRDDLQFGRQLRSKRFNLAIDLHGGPRGAWFAWASRARARVGYDVPGRSWMYTHVVSRPKTYRPRHAVENQWDLLAAADTRVPRLPSPDAHPVEMWSSRADTLRINRLVREAGVTADAEIIVLHVSAGNAFRRWPEGAFTDLTTQLVGSSERRVVVIMAGPSDREAAARIARDSRRGSAGAAARILPADNLSLGELRALLDRSSLFIGGDSGPLHVASTSAVPIVGIYGPTLPERSRPWRPAASAALAVEPDPLPCRPCDQRTCLPGDFRCLTSISAGRVADAALRLLGTHA